ncbi:hypothetical protein ACJWDR_02650 [Streptomyces tauricus]|uniref:hypothetical protein n=1 Tax=Streptomyces tauricus TaxID=68274 RepID=UPI00387F184C
MASTSRLGTSRASPPPPRSPHEHHQLGRSAVLSEGDAEHGYRDRPAHDDFHAPRQARLVHADLLLPLLAGRRVVQLRDALARHPVLHPQARPALGPVEPR